MIHSERLTAEVEGDFVVFLIGMRINKPWKIHKWLPVVLATWGGSSLTFGHELDSIGMLRLGPCPNVRLDPIVVTSLLG
ncbi:monooxygenase family protein [Duganella sp. HH101]|uniref:monooxygenase family protein n=1 Tax=Duganella sp. HH101 TaxID=1781066 RepID=UPI000873A9E9|nr:DUF4188 domain-containing protein [Duganella sp. HH101]OFA03606.1 hypothetical protein DUGA2_26440 [Duganella sp. HH101]